MFTTLQLRKNSLFKYRVMHWKRRWVRRLPRYTIILASLQNSPDNQMKRSLRNRNNSNKSTFWKMSNQLISRLQKVTMMSKFQEKIQRQHSWMMNQYSASVMIELSEEWKRPTHSKRKNKKSKLYFLHSFFLGLVDWCFLF